MRNFSYGIGFFAAVFLLTAGFWFSYTQLGGYGSETCPETMEAENPLRSRYHIQIEEGKVIVRLDNGAVYETTAIYWDTLPARIQEEIQKGYVIESKQELYSFLENYSS